MAITKENQEFIKWRHVIGFHKFPQYLKVMKQKYPNKDLHHVCGSKHSKKYTDALVVPLEHTYHLTVIDKAEARYFPILILPAWEHWLKYCCDIMPTKIIFPYKQLREPTPEQANKLICMVYRHINFPDDEEEEII
jgi:hypothetical protein